ncbi:MAG: 50S ribosomal protein L10 [Candidatus Omnitrophota bacterium]|nr:MAG: 50S ribosomal protein L10 [Candidatus Omnitrophota bacterium]
MAHYEKKYMVKEVSRQLHDASGLVVTNFDKLPVVEIDSLRRNLNKVSAKLIVAKNTLLKIALSDLKLNSGIEFIGTGTTGLAIYKNDSVAAIKILFDFSKQHSNFEIRGGFIDNLWLDAGHAKELSELPSKDVLRATVLRYMNSPITGFVNVLAGSMRGFVRVLSQIAKQKED